MSTGGKKHRPTSQEQSRLLNEQRQIEAALEQQKQIEGFEEGQDFDSQQAAQLQPHMGNQSVQDLISRLNNVQNNLQVLEEEGQDFEEEQQEDLEIEEDLKGSFGGGGDSGSGSSSSNPWETEFFYGGDDDEEGKKHRKKRRRRRVDYLPTQEEDDKEEKQAPSQSILEHVLPTPSQGLRKGDSIYKSVELCLMDPVLIFGQNLDPNSLKDRKGNLDPIRGPIEIGRFLSEHAEHSMSQNLASMLGSPAAALLTPQGGSSTAVARLATLAVCAEVAEGGGISTDRAVSLSLHKGVWTKAVHAAKILSQQGQLHAPKICSLVLQKDFQDHHSKLPNPNLLGGAALRKTLPHPLAVSLPYLALKEEEEEIFDSLVAQLDRTMETLITGMTPEESKKTTIDYEVLQPALKSANTLLGALGRSQVEFAAAAIAVKNTYEQASVISTLHYADTALRQLAQATVQAGRTLERLYGGDLEQAQQLSASSIQLIKDTKAAMLALRTWCFSTIAGAINYQN